MPQLSPMMGVLVFICTNLAFTTLLLSIRPSFSVDPSSDSSTPTKVQKAFRSFS
uniref:ATP synthase F0 subunit 8 n=1 Tax=Elysia chlorotica TaxID=188477 RepID=B2D6J4_ELYCH|nr:ATP synthase F0 subunit 8 [Elysia chlorotica]ACB70185.1 ATP synthase F0 subunit 8 [Elysia chlorotica]